MIRLRKIVATLALVIFVILYSLAVMVFAVKVLPDAGTFVELIFYVVAGLLWVVPAGGIIWLGWRGERAITPQRTR